MNNKIYGKKNKTEQTKITLSPEECNEFKEAFSIFGNILDYF